MVLKVYGKHIDQREEHLRECIDKRDKDVPLSVSGAASARPQRDRPASAEANTQVETAKTGRWLT
jgi:hypothetical protein